MRLKALELERYRNYEALSVGFDAAKVILLGNNAQGKTNLLEAIALLATGRAPNVARDADLIRFGAENAVVRADIERSLTSHHLDLMLRTSGRRAFKLDGVPQKRLADVLGRVLVVFFRAEDLALVKGGPGERRDFLDTILIQLSGAYYQAHADYQRVLTQRNALLRAIADGRGGADDLAPWDVQLAPLAARLWKARFALVASLSERAAAYHERIAEGAESLTVRYAPALELDPGAPAGWSEVMLEALTGSRRAEIARGATLVGPHRDDLELLLDGRSARSFGSQGQQRTIVLALKLAELATMRAEASEPPLLLLDDVLAELDVKRQNALLAAIDPDVQTFVTTTHLNDFSARWLAEAEVFLVEAGKLGRLPR